MAQDWDDRDRWGRGGYGNRDDYPRRDRSRDWSDRAGDEVRSWLGDDDAERRRHMDERRDYGMMDAGRRGDDYGYGRSARGSGYDPYGADRGGYGRGGGYGDRYGAAGPGMAGAGMGMSSYQNRGMDYDRPGFGGRDYGGRDFGGRDYGGRDYGGRDFGGRDYGGRDYGGRDYGGRGYGQDSYRGGSDERGFFERAGDEVASWFGDEDAQRRREMDAGHRGRGPRNYSRSDDRIREDVGDRLSDDHHIDASDIEVAVSGGEVTLDGTVESRFAKRHAEDLAEACSGVRHVQNNLRVKDRQSDAGRFGAAGSTGMAGTGTPGATGMAGTAGTGTTGATGTGTTGATGSGMSGATGTAGTTGTGMTGASGTTGRTGISDT